MKIKIRHITILFAVILILILISYHLLSIEKKGIEIHNTMIDKETYTDVFGNQINATYYHIDLTLTNLEDYDISTAYVHFSLILHNNSVIEPNCFPFNQYSPEILSEDNSQRFEILFFIYDEINLPNELRYTYNDKELYTTDLINYEKDENDIVEYQFFIIVIIIGLIVLITIIICIIDMKKDIKRKKIVECIICLEDIPKGRAKFCENWLTETRLCNEGPFCSKKCLKEHLKREVHEHILSDGL